MTLWFKETGTAMSTSALERAINYLTIQTLLDSIEIYSNMGITLNISNRLRDMLAFYGVDLD